MISPAQNEAEGILLATGSEVQLAVAAQKELFEKGHDVSVVSMPSLELFEMQSENYKESVLPKELTQTTALVGIHLPDTIKGGQILDQFFVSEIDFGTMVTEFLTTTIDGIVYKRRFIF